MLLNDVKESVLVSSRFSIKYPYVACPTKFIPMLTRENSVTALGTALLMSVIDTLVICLRNKFKVDHKKGFTIPYKSFKIN